MRIAVIGTGAVGRAMAGGFAGAGHGVTVGTRDVAATLARTEPDRFGNPPLASWLQGQPEVRLATFADAAAAGDLVVNATSGDVSVEALRAAGAEHLAGKVLLDIANPLDFSQGFPPTLFVKETDSLGEQIQRAFPQARVVKTLNTMTAGLMLAPGQLSGPSAVFVSGDDQAAKKVVSDLLASFGWEQIVDLGGISTARGSEMLMPMWLQLMAAFGSPAFNWAIVK